MKIEQAICEVLIEATQQVLWPRLGRWVSRYVWPLTCRVGSGKATYFRASAGSNLIVYGRKMVASKLGGEKSHWLSYKEIQRRGYFESDGCLLNVFAHTVCHEFAHLVQIHHLGRKHGSVHNAAFYRVLDDVHHCGLANEVRAYISDRLQQRGIELTESQAALPVDVISPVKPMAIKRGQIILFKHEGGLKEAVVMRVNPKTVSAKPKNASAGLTYWRVPYGLITHVK